MIKNIIIIFLLLFTVIDDVRSQTNVANLQQINEQRLQLNQSGMKVLGGWAVTNMIAGGIGLSQMNGRFRHFHEMNLAWNSVNLLLAGAGYLGARNDGKSYTLSETIREFQQFENVLLFNAGLDIGYMAAGAYLWERGIRKKSDRLIGYGQSIILQGGFLFAFDLILFTLSRNQSSNLLDSLARLSFRATGINYKISF